MRSHAEETGPLEIRPPVAVLIVSGSDSDIARLAQRVADRECGDVSIALLKLGETDAVPEPAGSPVAPDLSSISAQVPKHLAPTLFRCAELCTPTTGAPATPAVGACGESSPHRVSDPITVLIASARETVVTDLRSRLAREQDIRVLDDAVADPALLLLRLEQHLPTMLLVDDSMIAALGARTLRTIRRRFPQLRCLVVADEVRHGLVEDVLSYQFSGLLLTGSPADAYVKAIRAVDRGELWLPRALLAKAVSELLQGPGECAPKVDAQALRVDEKDALTRRETQIVALLSQGFTNKEIGRQLGIMEDTVKKHVQGVFGKLGIHRRTLVALRQAATHHRPSRDAHDFPFSGMEPGSRI